MSFAVHKGGGIVKDIVNRIHKDIGKIYGYGHEQRKADDNKDASHKRTQYLSVGLAHLVIQIKALACDSHNGEYKHHYYTDSRHAPVDSIDDFVAEEHVYQVFIVVIIFCGCDTCKNAEKLLKPANKQAHYPFDRIQ